MSDATEGDMADLPHGNRGHQINITAALMMVAAWIFLGLRLKIRWPWGSRMGWDDIAVMLGTVMLKYHSRRSRLRTDVRNS